MVLINQRGFSHFSLIVLDTIMFFRYVEGGMGSVSMAVGNAAKEAGAHIITSAEVCISGINFSSFICHPWF